MRLVISRGAERDLRKLSREVAVRVAAAIDGLEQNPRPPGCRLLRDYEPATWRVRVGDWRILYEIDDRGGIVTVTAVRHRGTAY